MHIVYAWTVNSVNRLVKNSKHDSNSPIYSNLTFSYSFVSQPINQEWRNNSICITNARLLACDVDGKMLGLDDEVIAVVCSQN